MSGPSALDQYLSECRALVIAAIGKMIPGQPGRRPLLYEAMLDYPFREAKGLRPALCVAVCRALGGRLEAVLPSAAVIELYHNAFLIHDDIEDGSEKRRDDLTLYRKYGMPIAVNVGDAMLATTLPPLLDNMRLLDLGRALRILDAIARMARESAEGQAIELEWVRNRSWGVTEREYVRMVHKKTSWYTFIAPVTIGAIAGEAPPARMSPLRRFAAALGIAFQIRDDVLNLSAASAGAYGKEIGGDLWEGKHTLILASALSRATPAERARAAEILAKSRPDPARIRASVAAIRALAASGDLTPRGRDILAGVLTDGAAAEYKSEEEVRWLQALIDRHGALGHAAEVSVRWARRAGRVLDVIDRWMKPSVHREFLRGLVDYVVARER